MKHIKTEIIIDSSAEKIWNILMDFKTYSIWNPFIVKINGIKKEGKKLKVKVQFKNGRKMNIRPTITEYEERRKLRWLGSLGVKGVFDGEHYFCLEPIEKEKTKFIHGEKFTGILVATAGKTLESARHSFEEMNLALKEKCENNG
ncbi:SRPBCC domain-containing protein [Aureivirga sp. CE67]|uniref:SRPBCC domain-containing protein n=1 Tax=Aureivirga sp. CE67 TaxID=1788983 RepID=UPI0018CB91B2|nr:SRPBCC domain-containing protein [Aureivirga sp. CE67]